MSETAVTAKILKMDSKHRKTYRVMIELGKKLDDIYKSDNAFTKLFQPETTMYREKLQRYCETLIFKEPIYAAKKAEEILWRRVFYEIIHIVKSNKKHLKANAQIETMYRLHLSSAYGFYNHLVLKFQTEFSALFKLFGFLDFPLLSQEKQPLPSNFQENAELVKEVLTRILHKFLICLGDLSRYQIEYDPSGCPRLAHKYYQMSLFLSPSNGMPLNQLGTLHGSENYGCDAAFYYLYSLSCSEFFPSAKVNLKLLFNKNRKRYEEIKSTKFIDREKCADFELRIKEIKKFLVFFLHIIDSVLSGENDTVGNHQLQELCQICLQDFNSFMFYRADQNAAKLSYLPDELVFKLTLTILMSIEQLKGSKKTQGYSGKAMSSVYFTTVAFALIFFSHIVNHAIIRLQEAILGKNKKPILSCGEEEITSEVKTKELEEDHNGKEEPLKKKVHLLYGNRRRKHNSDSETSESRLSVDGSSDDEIRSQRSDRPRRSKKTKESANFLEREDLSETELNNFSSDSSSSSNSQSNSSVSSSSSETSIAYKLRSKHENKHDNILGNKLENKQESKKSIQSTVSIPTSRILESIETNDPNLSYHTNNAIISFKEFSSQLYSRLSILHEPSYSVNIPQTTQSEDFIDNEVYKFVLNGKQVDIPPGFEVNAKEVQEIEELGKKLATFQIETDTEMSLYNSEENSATNSDVEIDEQGREKKQETKRYRDGNVKSSEEKSTKRKAMKLESKKNNIKALVAKMQNQALLPTIKVFCDWLLCNKKIIQSISQVSTTIWSKLAVLLNCIPLEKHIANEVICVNSYVRELISQSSETQSWNCQPLSEDVQMRSFGALRLEHLSLNFDINKINLLNASEENLIRLCHLRRFGYLIASLSRSQSFCDGLSFFEYDAEKAMFIAPNYSQNILEHAGAEIKNREDLSDNTKENRKLQLMKNMAQLKLEAEISQLESCYKNKDSNWSPYLVPDTFALCENLKIFQELSRTGRFIIIIPLIVIDQLDSIKKESKSAREAIRWLENQFKQGNRFLRAQTQNEKVPSNYEVGLKKKDLEQWRFWQLIDCCKYFQQESVASGEDKKNNMVSLLVNIEMNQNTQDVKSKNQIKIANEKEIDLVNVREFNEKWIKANNK